MKDNILTFEEKIKSSFKRHLRLPLIGLLITLLSVIFLLNFNNNLIEPNKGYSLVSRRFDDLIHSVEMTLETAIQEDSFIESIKDENISQYPFTNLYYQLLQNSRVNLDYVILNSELEPIHATRNIFDNSVYVSTYNKLFSTRIQNSSHVEIGSVNLNDINVKQNALAIGQKIDLGHDDYAIFIVYVDPLSMESLIDQYYVNYVVVTDQFGYVVASSSDVFSDQLNRFNTKQDSEVTIENSVYRDFHKENQQLVFHMLNVKVGFFNKYGLLIVFMIVGFYIFKVTQDYSSRIVGEEISQSLNELKDAIGKVQSGQVGYQTTFKANDEMVYLIEAFNKMSFDLNKQIKDNENLLILKNQAQIKQLEAQFNPHFLYNSLETIKYLITLNPQKATEMILNLNYLLRYSIDISKQEVSLQEDVDYVIKYLEIIRTRLEDRFSYEINIARDIEDEKVPRLLIQPLIENSVKHGFQDKETLNISIFGFSHENHIYIGIYDDGGGMAPEKLEAIQKSMKEEMNIQNAFGLHNLYQRLRLMYGENADMRVNSFDGNTNIIIKIPQGDKHV